MKAFLSMGWSLITFRAGPDALPYAPRMILPLVALNLALGFVIQSLAGSGMDKPVVQLSAMALAAEALWLWLLLRRRGWDNRWVQGFSALVLIDTFITALAAPLALLAGASQALLAAGAVAQIVMTLWSLTVRGAIYQHTLEIERWKGILLALTPLFAVMLLTILLFPELLPAPPPQV